MAPRVTRFWLVRHAPVVGAEGRVYGQDDHAADCSDATAFAALERFLPQQPLWLATPLRRTHQTLQAIAAARRGDAFDHAVEASFVEQHFGDWQGLTYEELAARQDVVQHRFWHAPASHCPPNGESFASVVARVEQALLRLARTHGEVDIVAVMHGGSIRAALAAALALDPERALSFVIDTLSVTRLDHIEGTEEGGAAWRVHFVNRRA